MSEDALKTYQCELSKVVGLGWGHEARSCRIELAGTTTWKAASQKEFLL